MPEVITEGVVKWLMTPQVMEDFPSLDDLTSRPAWMKRAQCRGQDPALFFPTLGANVAKARALCSSCPVRAECLDYALADPESAGVWGWRDGARPAEAASGGVRARRPRAHRKRPGVPSASPDVGREDGHNRRSDWQQEWERPDE